MYNEQPTLLAILIVTYVITKSFSILFYSNHSFIICIYIIYDYETKKKKNR